MSENENGFDYLLADKLKTVSQKSLEKAISKAVSELVDKEFNCSINAIKYDGFIAEVEMSLSCYKKKDR